MRSPPETDVLVKDGHALGFMRGFEIENEHSSREPDLEALRTVAPEQLASSRGADARSEVWATGVVTYAMLSGRFPFDADSVPELRARIAEGSFVALGRLRPDVPCGLADVVHRCLERDPARRYANAAEVALALLPFAELVPRAKPRSATRMSAIAVLGVGLVLAGIGAALSLSGGEAASVARRPARAVAPDVVGISRTSDAVTGKAPSAPTTSTRLLTATDILGY